MSLNQPSAHADEHVPLDRFRVGFVLFTIFLFWSAMYVYVPILPVYARGLGASLTVVGLLVGAYGFSQMVLRLPVGVLSDRIGRRRPFLSAGFVAAGLGALGLALAPTPEWLVVARGVVGIAAATWVASTILYTGFFPPGQMTRAIGLLSFVSGIAQLVATSAGGQIAEQFGSQAAFLSGTAIAAVGLVLSFWVPERRANATTPHLRDLVKIAAVPSLLSVSIISALSQYASWASTYAFVPVYADILGASRADLGTLTAASLAAQTIATLMVAPLSHRLGPRPVMVGSLLALALSIAVVPFQTDLLPLALWQALGGFGRGLCQTGLMAAALRGVDPNRRATAMGVYQAIYAIGMFVGPVTAGMVADNLGLAGAFYASAGLVALGAAMALRSR